MIDPNASTEAGLHEPDSLNLRTVTLWGFALALLVVLSLLMMYALMGVFERRSGVDGINAPKSAERITADGSNAPSPTGDQLSRARATERRQLEQYGWVDREQKITCIPIERAMQLLLDRGLPVRKTPPESE